MKNIKAQRSTGGFTLIEMLMVVFLFGLIMTLSGALFSAVLKGSGKSEITKEVKQTGDYAVGMMERTIRNAKSVSSCSLTPSTSISVTDRNNIVATFGCFYDNGLGLSGIASSSGVFSDKLTGNNVTLGGTSCADTNMTLRFTCNPDVNPPQVKIGFTLKQIGTSVRPEDQASVNFQSTVNLRTY